LSQMWSNQRM